MVGLDATSATSQNSGGTLTLPHTICAGANRYLVAAIGGFMGASPGTPTATYDGVAMSLIKYQVGGDATQSLSMFGLAAPHVGTHDIVFTLPGADWTPGAAAVSYTGVRQGGNALGVPVGHNAVNNQQGTFDMPGSGGVGLLVVAMTEWSPGAVLSPSAITTRAIGGPSSDDDKCAIGDCVSVVGPTTVGWTWATGTVSHAEAGVELLAHDGDFVQWAVA